ncbi:MAG: hypothetical protein ACI9DK_003386 [Vicingaceae bacterium]|jgi:hypothetical protein
MDIIINGKRVDKSQILYYLENGQKIVAIKVIKDLTNIGLKECKEIIDNLELNSDYYDGEEQVIETNLNFSNDETSEFKPAYVDDYKKAEVSRSRSGNYLKDKADSRYDTYIILFIVFCLIVVGYIFFNK